LKRNLLVIFFSIIVIILTIVIIIKCNENNIENIIDIQYLNKNLGINLNPGSCKILYTKETHGGMGNDGDFMVVVNCEMQKDEIKKLTESWDETPLSEDLNILVYGGKKNDINYKISNIMDYYPLPEIKTGKYIFIDKNQQTNNKFSLEDIPRNYIIAIYNYENNVLYFYECDT